MVTRTSQDPIPALRPALASIEVASVARGIAVLDQMAKRAETTIAAARTLSPGRYLIVLSSSVAEIEEAVAAGLDLAKEERVDHVILHDPAQGLRDALASSLSTRLAESLAIVETTTVSAALAGVDRTLKGSDVELLELRLGAGLSGKGVFTLTGPLHMIEAARAIAESSIGPERLVRIEVIAQPHPDLPSMLLGAEQALPRGIG